MPLEGECRAPISTPTSPRKQFEYQGEDPWLASRMVAAEVRGIQSQNVSGCVKHYGACPVRRTRAWVRPSSRATRPPPPAVFNNEETDRGGMSSNVPDRAAKELYYKPFGAAVDAGVGSAMCSCAWGWGGGGAWRGRALGEGGGG